MPALSVVHLDTEQPSPYIQIHTSAVGLVKLVFPDFSELMKLVSFYNIAVFLRQCPRKKPNNVSLNMSVKVSYEFERE